MLSKRSCKQQYLYIIQFISYFRKNINCTVVISSLETVSESHRIGKEHKQTFASDWNIHYLAYAHGFTCLNMCQIYSNVNMCKSLQFN